MLVNVLRIKDDKYFSFQIISPGSVKKEAGEDERREEDEERDGGWWSSITEIWVTVALGIIVSSHLPAPDIDSFLFSDAVQGELIV